MPKFYYLEDLVGPLYLLECYPFSAEGALFAILKPESLPAPALKRESWLYLPTDPWSLNWRPLYSEGAFLPREALELILLIILGSPFDTMLAPTVDMAPLVLPVPLLSRAIPLFLELMDLLLAEYLG